MGKQQTRIKFLRFSFFIILTVFSCLFMGSGFCLLNANAKNDNDNQSDIKKIDVQDAVSEDTYWGTEDGIRVGPLVSNGNTYYINSGGQLAWFNYMLTTAGKTSLEDGNAHDYSNCTFVLTNNIELDSIPSDQGEVNPLWVPIEIGKNAKNRNITFDGAGFSISGLRIKYKEDETPRNVGFFAELYGGVFKNVVFKSPVIEYEYKGKSIAADNPLRPDAPIEVGVGIIAGSADSTYIENVVIENPSITVTTENTNGHNFYVGTAVGKMSFTMNMVNEGADDETRKSINTVTPTQWGINTVNVWKNDTTSTGLTFNINEGSEPGQTYGEATNAYLGGLVGVNVNSKVINSTLHSLSINANYTAETVLEGTYFVGGLVGLSTQILSREELLTASGLYNNLLINVSLKDIRSVTSQNYCGNLVGRIYSGGWVYNNMIIGNMPYDNFWGQAYNATIRWVLSDTCIGNHVGSMHDYYFDANNENETFPQCDISYVTAKPYKDSDELEYFDICVIHGYNPGTIVSSKQDSASPYKMSVYNYSFDSLESEDYIDFCAEKHNVDGSDKTNFELMNYFQSDAGYLYHAIQPILEYEVGLTINEINSETGEVATDNEKRVDAVYQFRSWDFDEETNEPLIGDYTGLDYQVTYEANSPEDSDAFWTVNENGFSYEVSEISAGRTYQKIYQPEDPECSGYEFVGWKIKGLEKESDNSERWQDYREKLYIDQDGFYQFGKEELLEPDRRFIAIWEKLQYKVTFIVREEGKADKVFDEYNSVYFGSTVDQPKSDPVSVEGYKFAGWFLEENLPEDGSDADTAKQWEFGSEGNTMPGNDLVLYSGWIDNITMLRELLDDEKYLLYKDNYKIYFEDNAGQNFFNAYNAALSAKENTENLTVPIGTLLKNLENAYNDLRVDPKKLLELPAFDESLIENVCPFLYKDEARMRYTNFKKTVKEYAESNEVDTANIDAYIKNYDNLKKMFENLKLEENWNESVKNAGGINTDTVEALIEKYQILRTKSESLDKTKYTDQSLAYYEDAQDQLNKLWNAETGDPSLKDVELAIKEYETAFNNLKLAETVNTDNVNNADNVNSDNSGKKLPMSPLAFGVIIVLVLVAGVGGYIGYDVMKNKKAFLKSVKTINQYNEVIEEDDEGYF